MAVEAGVLVGAWVGEEVVVGAGGVGMVVAWEAVAGVTVGSVGREVVVMVAGRSEIGAGEWSWAATLDGPVAIAASRGVGGS